MKFTFDERINQAFNFMKISIHYQGRGRTWTVFATSLRFGVCQIIYEGISLKECLKWVKRNVKGNTAYNLIVADPYNDKKMWHVRHYSDGHYTINQYIGNPYRKFNKRFIRVRKHLIEEMFDFPIDKV